MTVAAAYACRVTIPASKCSGFTFALDSPDFSAGPSFAIGLTFAFLVALSLCLPLLKRRTCTGPSSSSCVTCMASNFRTVSSSTCPCDPGYYDVLTGLCSACHYTCLYVQPLGNRVIIVSVVASPLGPSWGGSGVCNAPPSFIWVAHRTCNGAGASKCLTCKSASSRTLTNSTTCPCNAGTFDAGVGNCGLCNSTCRSVPVGFLRHSSTRPGTLFVCRVTVSSQTPTPSTDLAVQDVQWHEQQLHVMRCPGSPRTRSSVQHLRV